MADVTFGVKVSEEMKNELSDLMKDSTLSGKEFMAMLISSYKLEKTKDKAELFEGDLKELQGLIKRVQSIFINMIDKSELEIESTKRAFEEKIEEKVKEKEGLTQIIEEQKKKIEALQKQIKVMEENEKEVKSVLDEYEEDIKSYKQQIKNQALLHTKYDNEIAGLHEKIEEYKRLDIEIQERNDECTKLKQRNDEIASEVWFLKREVEKVNNEKATLKDQYTKEMKQLNIQHGLELKNQLLEQKVANGIEKDALKEEINRLRKELIDVTQEKNKLESQQNK